MKNISKIILIFISQDEFRMYSDPRYRLSESITTIVGLRETLFIEYVHKHSETPHNALAAEKLSYNNRTVVRNVELCYKYGSHKLYSITSRRVWRNA